MPLYQAVYDRILAQIASRELTPGDKLPAELELAEQFGVSRPTVRTALQKLEREGHLTRTRRRGTFVTVPKLVNESTQFIESYREELRQKGLEPRTHVLELRLARADEKLQNKLELSKGERVLVLKRLRSAPGSELKQPLVLTTVYLSYARFPFLLEYDFETVSLYEALAEHGVETVSVERELEIALLDGAAARLLDCRAHSPAHFISSLGRDREGRPVEYAESYYPGERNKFILRIER